MRLTSFMLHLHFLFIGCSTAVRGENVLFSPPFHSSSRSHWHAHIHTGAHEFMHYLADHCLSVWNVFILRLFVFNFCLQVSRSPKKKKKDSRKQTGGNSSFKCSKLISARQDLITQPSLLQLTSVQRRTGKTQFLNYLICVIWCFYFFFSLVSENEGEGFPKFVLGSRAAQLIHVSKVPVSCTRWECRSCWIVVASSYFCCN